jgi:hypothetical protein
MFAATAFAYPLVLALLCVGAGLLIDRVSGRFLHPLLLPSVGAAALIALSQLETDIVFAARATPYVMAVIAAAGFVLERRRVWTLLRHAPRSLWLLGVPAVVYLLALAPVIVAGRPSFSSYLVLGDSAVHMLGAYFLPHHGQEYSHLNPLTSYGLYIKNYYGTSYPSGSDTLFGASALLLGLPLIWAFQPFNAMMVALAAGPVWVLVRRIGVPRPLAVPATLSVTLPALVYGYELIGSIKEITSLGMILTLGVLVVFHDRWLLRSARHAIPFSLVLAAGVSSLGVGFGVWGAGEALVLGPILIKGLLDGARAGSPLALTAAPAGGARVRPSLALLATGALATGLAALPTWGDLSGSLSVAGSISSTVNPGNLTKPLHVTQIFGVWLRGSYKALPVGASVTPTDVLIAITGAAVLIGAVRLVRSRERALAGWIAAMLLVWLVVNENSTTWVSAKTLMLTSPVVVLLAWAGVAELAAAGRRRPFGPLAALLAVVLFGGVVASNALQYHESDLAPTARFDELASIDSRFAGRGPALFTDFDEYSLYLLRDIEVAGPNFIYGPKALLPYTPYRYPVELDRLPPRTLLGYPLIITRRGPAAARPPSAYRLLWQGLYYQVWGRRRGAPAALADRPAARSLSGQCAQIHALASLAAGRHGTLVAAASPGFRELDIEHSSRPRAWGRMRIGVQLVGAGRLSAQISLPSTGRWEIWLQGQIMPTVKVAVDGHTAGSLGGQLGGNSVVPNSLTPLSIFLARGSHTVTISRGGTDLAPGNGGSAALYHVLLTPAAPSGGILHSASPARWHSLCGRYYQWIEVLPRKHVGERT